VVGDFINMMKTTFDFNSDLNKAFQQQEYTKTETERIKKASLLLLVNL